MKRDELELLNAAKELLKDEIGSISFTTWINPLEIKEGLIHRVINWCKSRTKSIITVGSIGLVLTGI